MIESEIAFRICQSPDQVAEIAARRILETAREAIARHGRFRVALAGGRTPLSAYTVLADGISEWDRWHIFWGDERCLDADDPERNSRAATDTLLARVPIPPENLNPIPAELGAEVAASRYEALIRDQLPLDLAILGLGEDGHTASLFPGHSIPDDAWVIPVHQAPKYPSDRVSLTPRVFSSSLRILVLVTGVGKREVLARWRQGAELPIARATAGGCVEVLMDPAAAGPAEC